MKESLYHTIRKLDNVYPNDRHTFSEKERQTVMELLSMEQYSPEDLVNLRDFSNLYHENTTFYLDKKEECNWDISMVITRAVLVNELIDEELEKRRMAG